MYTWTIAYRNPRANHFRRVTNWSGTWHQSVEMAKIFLAANPGIQVWTVPAEECERDQAARIARGELQDHGYSEDWGNILLANGRRVKMRETGSLPVEILRAFEIRPLPATEEQCDHLGVLAGPSIH